jgi:hypothetical protein
MSGRPHTYENLVKPGLLTKQPNNESEAQTSPEDPQYAPLHALENSPPPSYANPS